MKPGMKMIIMLVTAVSFWGGLFYFDGTIYRKRLGLSPDKLQIVKI